MQRAFPWFLLGSLAVVGGIALLAPALAQENRLPPGLGRDAVIAACSDCHGLVALNGKALDYGGWYGIVVEMMNNGASVPPEDREAIAAYLAEHFGPPKDAGSVQPAAK
jgi:mono/diheme cytochrome c family protein